MNRGHRYPAPLAYAVRPVRPSAREIFSSEYLPRLHRGERGQRIYIARGRNDLSINRIPALARVKSNFRRGPPAVRRVRNSRMIRNKVYAAARLREMRRGETPWRPTTGTGRQKRIAALRRVE